MRETALGTLLGSGVQKKNIEKEHANSETIEVVRKTCCYLYSDWVLIIKESNVVRDMSGQTKVRAFLH